MNKMVKKAAVIEALGAQLPVDETGARWQIRLAPLVAGLTRGSDGLFVDGLDVESLAALRSLVYGIGRRFSLRGEDLQDCFQGVCLKLVETDYLSKFDGNVGNINSFLAGFAFNYIVDGLRSSRRQRATDSFDRVDEDGNPIIDVSTDDVSYVRVEDEELTTAFRQILSGVKYHSSHNGIPRSLLYIFNSVLEGNSSREIAIALGVSTSWINSQRGIITQKAAAFIADRAK